MVRKCLLIGLAIILTVGALGSTSCSCEKDGVSGKYFHEDDPESYLELYSDGTFYLYYDAGLDFGTRTGIRGGLDGTYRVKDDTIILSSTLGASKLLIGNNELIDEQDKRWMKGTAGTPVKKTTEPTTPESTTVKMSPGETVVAFFNALREGRYSDAETYIALESKVHDLEEFSDELGGNYSSLAEVFREIPQEDLPKRVEIADEDIIGDKNAEVDCELYFSSGDMDTASFTLIKENLTWKLVLYPVDTESPPAPAPAPAPAPPPAPLAEPLDNGAIFGDFSVGLTSVTREADKCVLDFAIRRVNSSTDNSITLSSIDEIKIIDDRDNVYQKDWQKGISWGGWNWISYSEAPVGFTWVARYIINMPTAAPIVKIQLLRDNDKVWEHEYGWGVLSNLGVDIEPLEGMILTDQTVPYTKNIQWSVGSANWVDQEYLIPFNLHNLDYSPRELQLTIRVQETDRHIRDSGVTNDYGGYCKISLPGKYTTVCNGFIRAEIPAQSNVQVLYHVPLGQDAGDLPDRLLILGKDENGWEKSYIIDIGP